MDHPFGDIWLHWKTVAYKNWEDKLEFGRQLEIWPVTITPARYGGVYESSSWLAFPCYPGKLDELCPEWNDSDVECMIFWDNAKIESWPIGHGSDPLSAYKDLIRQVKILKPEVEDEEEVI